MLIGSVPNEARNSKERIEDSAFQRSMADFFVVLELLALGEVYTLLQGTLASQIGSKLGATRSVQSEQAGLRNQANAKRHRFNLSLLPNDMMIPKSKRTVDEPIFFATDESRQLDELVINTVDQNRVTGYISTPKYSQPEMPVFAPSGE